MTEQRSNSPLPLNYSTLTKGDQRRARVHACSQFGTVQDSVRSWAMFRRYYLFGTKKGDWYRSNMGLIKSPPFHYEIIRDWAGGKNTAHAAPRGFAKSTLAKEWILLRSLTTPFWETGLFLSSDRKISAAMGAFQRQLISNPRIIRDFGNMHPKRGQGTWNQHTTTLLNGSKIIGLSVRGTLLGERPNDIFLDDVEPDPQLVVVTRAMLDQFKGLIFNVIMPMAEEGVHVHIIGTVVGAKAFLPWILNATESRITEFWVRRRYQIYMEGEGGKRVPLWKDKYDEEGIKKLERKFGSGPFSIQFMNEPLPEGDRIFNLDEESQGYTIESPDNELEITPLESKSVLVGQRKIEGGWKKVWRPFGKTIGGMRRVLLVDYASTVSDSSDYSAIQVLGFENSEEFPDTIWSLDLWVGKLTLEGVIGKLYMMARKWVVSAIGVEAFPVQMGLAERAREKMPELFSRDGLPVPPVIYIRFPPQYSKADRIKGLAWRFNIGRIKLPFNRGGEMGYKMLFFQLDHFTDGMELLKNDDALDTLSMQQALPKPYRTGEGAEKSDIALKTPLEMLKEGELYYESGIPVTSGIDWSKDKQAVSAFLTLRRDKLAEQSGFDFDELEELEDEDEIGTRWLQGLITPGHTAGTTRERTETKDGSRTKANSTEWGGP